jgi:hypothetical protein
MLHRARCLRRFQVAAIDRTIGTIADVLFDTRWWCIRYFLVATGRWVPCRSVLISPISVDRMDWAARCIALALTHEQVRHSPRVQIDCELARADEIANAQHFAHRPYWEGGALWGTGADPAALRSRTGARAGARAPVDRTVSLPDVPVRSARDLDGFRVACAARPLGYIADFLVEESSWAIRYLVVTRTCRLGRPVLIPPGWISQVDATTRAITTDIDDRLVRRAPRFVARAAIDRRWEAAYYAHFGRPGYWISAG